MEGQSQAQPVPTDPATSEAAASQPADGTADAMNAMYDRLRFQLTEAVAQNFQQLRGLMETQLAAGFAQLAATALAQTAAQPPAAPAVTAESAGQPDPVPATPAAVPAAPVVPVALESFAKPSLKGPVFSGYKQGAGHEVHAWASKMDDHLRLIGQLETTLGPTHVGQCLEGSAQTWYHSRKTAAGNLPPFSTWLVMRAELIREFAYIRSGRDAFRQLQKLEQRSTSVRDYTKRFRNPVMLVYPATCSEQTQLELYLSGLRSDLRGFVESQTPEAVEKAIASAEALDQCFTSRADNPRRDRREEHQRDARAQRHREQPRDQRFERRPGPDNRPRFEPRRFQPPAPPNRGFQPAYRGPAPMELGAMRPAPGRNQAAAPARAPARPCAAGKLTSLAEEDQCYSSTSGRSSRHPSKAPFRQQMPQRTAPPSTPLRVAVPVQHLHPSARVSQPTAHPGQVTPHAAEQTTSTIQPEAQAASVNTTRRKKQRHKKTEGPAGPKPASAAAPVPEAQLLIIPGSCNGHAAWLLVDSGAQMDFLSEQFALKHGIPLQRGSATTVRMASG